MPKFLELSLFGMILIPTLLASEAKTEEKLDCGLGLPPDECLALLEKMTSNCITPGGKIQQYNQCLALEIIELQKQIGALKTIIDAQQPQIQALKNHSSQLEASLQNLKEEMKEEMIWKAGNVFHDPLQDGSLAPKMVVMLAGQFRMGDMRGDDDEKPVHDVSLNRFAISRYELTFAEYDHFAEATGRSKPDDNGWGRGKRPVINVSYQDAIAYAQWLSKQTGKQYRLPSEAEWEYAARAGTDTQYGWKTNDIGTNRANCDGCGSQWAGKQTAPVGSFAANVFGVYDLVGNVWEWTCSEYGQYGSGMEQQCSSDKSVDSNRVIRGGSWEVEPWIARVSSRNQMWNDGADSGVGFRVVRE
jgi:formylglycine-generating enzyme required for sulfatase activity